MSEQITKTPKLEGFASWNGIGTQERLAHWVEKVPDYDQLIEASEPDVMGWDFIDEDAV